MREKKKKKNFFKKKKKFIKLIIFKINIYNYKMINVKIYN
jgi:hypothetical protein